MTDARTSLLASAIVLGSGIIWGFYWLPVRALGEMGLGGAWGTVAITLAAAALIFPFVVTRRKAFAEANTIAVLSIAIGGAAFALYSIGLVYGRVAIIILLWFLSPVWSILIGRYLMGWSVPRMRLAAVAVGLVGLIVMLRAEGGIPVPRGVGEWMSLIGGFLWSLSNTGIRAKSAIEPLASAFIFACGAVITALAAAPLLEPFPILTAINPMSAIGIAVLAGGLWWGLAQAALMWATMRLDPARISILLMTEVLVGATSAALIAGESLHRMEIAGGAMVLCAGLLEVWPMRVASEERAVKL
jgi:drug/metabolite transporter (DMT)-like permease